MVILTLIPNSYIIIKIIPFGYNTEVKMYKKLLIISTTIIIIFLIIFVNNSMFINKNIENTDINIAKEYKNELSMMLETASGSGVYEKTTASEWPTEGYIFNSTLSKCENGGELSWDGENNRVIMSGIKSDKCYVYFDMIKLITFYIDDIEYKAVENMTWKEWVESNYCTIEISTSSVCTGNNNLGLGNQKYIFNSTGTYDLALTGDKIIENNKYLIRIYNEPCKVA